MNAIYHRLARAGPWPLALVAVTVVLLTLSGSSQAAPAAAPLAFGSVGQCVEDRFAAKIGGSGVVCTANDVSLSSYTLISGPTSCLPGEQISVVLKGQFGGTANERYDIGVFISTDGGNAIEPGGDVLQRLPPLRLDEQQHGPQPERRFRALLQRRIHVEFSQLRQHLRRHQE